MYNHSRNPQVQYSLEQLAKSLFYYIQRKSFDRITVTEICSRAGITRRTFYRNLDGKEDLIIFSTDYLVKSLLANVDFNCTDPLTLYNGFFSYWYEHRRYLSSLYNNGLFDLFSSEFLDICNEHLRYPLQEKSIEGTSNVESRRIYSNAFVIGGFAQMLKQWTSEGFSVSVEDVTESILFLSPKA